MSDGENTISVELRDGDAFDVLEQLDDNSVHAVVSDPPYGLAFMGKDWDDFEPREYQQWCEEWAEECLRVLKPGGHLLAFSGSRTHHRLFAGVEDAGFTVRDTVTWHYGSGFPKGQDVGKLIDRYSDEHEREKVEATGNLHKYRQMNDDGWEKIGDESPQMQSDKPASPEAEQWDGWRSQLKPAAEFVVLAQKPLDESAIYRQCLETGTGALNIDGCRVPPVDGEDLDWEGGDDLSDDYLYGDGRTSGNGAHDDGRYPANLLLSDGAGELLDENADVDSQPSRFFYQPKAAKSERTHEGEVDNDHPTVKPVELIQWLVRLVTREGQTVLDPFAGSGTTGLAAVREDRSCILIEREDEYIDIARERLLLERTLDGGDSFEFSVKE